MATRGMTCRKKHQRSIVSRENFRKSVKLTRKLYKKGICDEDSDNPTISKFWKPKNIARPLSPKYGSGSSTSLSSTSLSSSLSKSESSQQNISFSTPEKPTRNAKTKYSRKISSTSESEKNTQPEKSSQSSKKSAHNSSENKSFAENVKEEAERDSDSKNDGLSNSSDDFENQRPSTMKKNPLFSREAESGSAKYTDIRDLVNKSWNDVKNTCSEAKNEYENTKDRFTKKRLRQKIDPSNICGKFHSLLKKYSAWFQAEAEKFERYIETSAQEPKPSTSNGLSDKKKRVSEVLNSIPMKKEHVANGERKFRKISSSGENSSQGKIHRANENGKSAEKMVTEIDSNFTQSEFDERAMSPISSTSNESKKLHSDSSGSSTDVPVIPKIKEEKNDVAAFPTDREVCQKETEKESRNNDREDEATEKEDEKTETETDKMIVEDVTREIKQEILSAPNSQNPQEKAGEDVDPDDCFFDIPQVEPTTVNEEVEGDIDFEEEETSGESMKRQLLNSDSSDESLDSPRSWSSEERDGFFGSESSQAVSGENRRKMVSDCKNLANDDKLRKKCLVLVERLDKSELRKHEEALKTSKNYLKQKRLENLCRLRDLSRKKKRKLESSDSDSRDGPTFKRKKRIILQDTEEEKDMSFSEFDSSAENGMSPKIHDESMESKEYQNEAEKQKMLHSESDDSDSTDFSAVLDSDSSETNREKKKNEHGNSIPENETKEESERRKAISEWKKDKLLTARVTNNSDEEKVSRRPKNSNKRARHESDSESESSASENFLNPKVTVKTEAPTETVCLDDAGDIVEVFSQVSVGKGRKNIKEIMKDQQVADNTKKAVTEEKKRLERLAERHTLFTQAFDSHSQEENTPLSGLILDFDKHTKEELVRVDDNLVREMKPHQIEGVKFMWDACFESLEQTKNSPGSGCILAQ